MMNTPEPIFRIPPICLALLAVLLAAHLLPWLFHWDVSPFLLQPAAFWTAPLSLPNLLSLLSYQFFHAGFLHLGVNMGMLLAFGSAMERIAGPLKFLPFYLLFGVIAALAQAAAMPDSQGLLVGASGAISGAMGFVLWRMMRRRPRERLRLITAMLATQPLLAWVAGTSLGGNIAWVAHLAGFVAGIGMAIYSRENPQSP